MVIISLIVINILVVTMRVRVVTSTSRTHFIVSLLSYQFVKYHFLVVILSKGLRFLLRRALICDELLFFFQNLDIL